MFGGAAQLDRLLRVCAGEREKGQQEGGRRAWNYLQGSECLSGLLARVIATLLLCSVSGWL